MIRGYPGSGSCNRLVIQDGVIPTWIDDDKKLCILCKYNKPSKRDWNRGLCTNKEAKHYNGEWWQFLEIECSDFEYNGSEENAIIEAKKYCSNFDDIDEINDVPTLREMVIQGIVPPTLFKTCFICKHRIMTSDDENIVCGNKKSVKYEHTINQYDTVDCSAFEMLGGSIESAVKIVHDAMTKDPYEGRPVKPYVFSELYHGNAPSKKVVKRLNSSLDDETEED